MIISIAVKSTVEFVYKFNAINKATVNTATINMAAY